jgi:hypothetical protein
MAIQILGLQNTGDNILGLDLNGNVLISEGMPTVPLSGGVYTVAGQVSSVVAASLAANTTLMSMRFSTTSLKKAYITRVRVSIAGSVGAVNGGVPGAISLQRFTSATPSGGTARVVNAQVEGLSYGSDMTDIRDNNAALTVTSVVFGNIVATALVPLLVGGAAWSEWIFEPSVPLVLNPGDGLALRTQTVMPATQTWVYAYTVHWYEMP